MIAEWGAGEDSFAKNPPNATVSVLAKDGSVKDAFVVLKNPKLEGDKLSFTVQTPEGDLAGADGSAAIFIDIIGRPLTPLSFAGVARRSAFRGAMYAGAARAAYGAAAYAAPIIVPIRPPPACGYYRTRRAIEDAPPRTNPLVFGAPCPLPQALDPDNRSASPNAT